ncbi:hypothetical protein L5515_015654 [Caenorhabditis briggsae]|uniref:BTB domain-containing protein n=1 Tax=Caenorhabditis briggsae TaxID=6238 RepID=A0AAE9ECB3_CAEBR|nr:hypothetical protein L5515_015654 [Caenorhabditis briggsae]
MPRADREFVLKSVIENVLAMKENEDFLGEPAEYFIVPWVLVFRRENGHLSLSLKCLLDDEKAQIAPNWAIKAEVELAVKSANGATAKKKETFSFGSETPKNAYGFQILDWNSLQNKYAIDGKILVQANVSIKEMAGISKKDLRNFDDSKREWADAVVKVEGREFHVAKLLLATQSTYFQSMFFGKFEESEKAEIELSEIRADDFQNFLETLHGEPAIDDDTVEGVLHLADMYDTPTARQRSEEFLMKESEKSMKEKLRISTKYRLDSLIDQCLSRTHTIAEIRAVLPGNLEDLDHSKPVFHSHHSIGSINPLYFLYKPKMNTTNVTTTITNLATTTIVTTTEPLFSKKDGAYFTVIILVLFSVSCFFCFLREWKQIKKEEKEAAAAAAGNQQGGATNDEAAIQNV